MFSEQLPRILRETEKMRGAKDVPRNEIISLLEKSTRSDGLEMAEIVALMDGARGEENRKTILDFSTQLKRPRDGEILLLPPLYFSSICENNCLYCHFPSHKGARLSIKEFKEEFGFLVEMGYRSIELVSSQDPKLYVHSDQFDLDNQDFRLEQVIRYFEASQNQLREAGGGMLTSNIPPVDGNNFRNLKNAGLDCYLVWLETFQPGQYSNLHNGAAPKANHDFRVNSFERAIDAGIPHVAGAFLKGLYDWRKEEVILYLLDKHLKAKNGKGFSIIGSPRLKGPFLNSPIVEPYSVSDEDYELNIALDRILFDGILWLQTRESFEWNQHLIQSFGGGVILTLTSCTAPGGYMHPPEVESQFPVFKQDLDASVAKLTDMGLKVIFDWDPQTLDSFQRNR